MILGLIYASYLKFCALSDLVHANWDLHLQVLDKTVQRIAGLGGIELDEGLLTKVTPASW